MRLNVLLKPIITAVLVIGVAWPGYASPGVVWTGDLTAEENYQDSESSFNSILQLKMELNSGEKQNGVVLLRYETADAKLADSSEANLTCYLAYIDLLPNANWLIRTGRQKISWGSGFSWNPTNYIGSGKNRSEFMQDNPGVDALDLEYTQKKYAMVAAVKPEKDGEATGTAFKLSSQILKSDLTVSAFQQDATKALGLDLSTVWGDLTVYLETAWKAGDRDYFYISNNTETERPEDQYYLHGVLGASGFIATDWSIILEYYYNQAGWNKQEQADYYSYYEAKTAEIQTGLDQKTAALLADLTQNYLYFSIKKDNFLFDDFSVSSSILWNLDDESYVLTPMLQYNLTQNAYVALNMNKTHGNRHSEFGASTLLNNLINAKLVIMF